MRFQDLQYQHIRAATHAAKVAAAAAPERQAEEERYLAGRRQYHFPLGITLHFDASKLLHYQSADTHQAFYLSAVGLTSAVLLQIAEAVRHVEAWVAGEVDELAPSGVWAQPKI